MSKTFTKLVKHALRGPTMGTQWTALFYTQADFDIEPVRAVLQAVVDEVDAQMSTWKSESDLMAVNSAPVGVWISVPAQLQAVLELGLEIGRESDGAFDIGMNDVVSAWGFGPEAATSESIQATMKVPYLPAYEVLELDTTLGRIRKHKPISLDLNGIAKGFGTDRLAETLCKFGIKAALVGIDGEMRALGLRPDGNPWTIAVEAPDSACRTPHSVLTIEDAAVATSGDYRHWVEVQGQRLSHTMNPNNRAPVVAAPASVSVVARSCAQADAWATALMVLGVDEGKKLARQQGLAALFILRDNRGDFRSVGVGQLFSDEPKAILHG